MNVTLVSFFRNATGYLPRFEAQADALASALERRGDRLTLVLGEGDSIDETRKHLSQWHIAGGLSITLMDVSHGGPPFGSVVHPLRFRQLAYVVNVLLGAVPDNADRVIYVESDLIWDVSTMLELLDQSGRAGVDIACPLILASDDPMRFYDIWAYVAEDRHFQPWPPYHPALADVMGHASVVPLQTAGSCLAMRGDVARQYRLTPDEAIRGFTRAATIDGCRLYLIPTAIVRHP